MSSDDVGAVRRTSKEAASVDVSDRDLPAAFSVDATIEAQTRTKRLFSSSQLFAYSLTYMSVWEALCGNIYYALYNGGANTLAWSVIIVFFGAIAQAASLGEMTSILPLAGAQYHWTWHLAPKNVRKFATYIQGWSTWFGYVSGLASCAYVCMLLLQSAIELNMPDFVFEGWHTTLMIIALCMVTMMLNMYCMKLIPWIETCVGILHVCLWVVFVVILAVMGARNDAEFVFLEKNISSGWQDRPFVSWNIGLLTSIWCFTGFDGAIHMSEETRSAKLSVPRAMFWSIFTNGILGFIMMIMVLVSMGSVDDALGSAMPIMTILLQVTRSTAATIVLISGMVVMGFGVTTAAVSSVSRLTWAWARDGGLPSYFAYISPKQRVPIRGIVLTVFIVCLLSLLNISSASYVAFGAILALNSLALYISYFIAISSMLYARYSYGSNLKLGAWNWGRWGGYINIFALVYTTYAIIWLPFPSTLPVTAANMNYSGPIMLFILLAAVLSWFVWARTKWAGPNLTIMDFIVATS